MRVAGQVLAAALVVYFVVVAPWYGVRRYARLRARLAAQPSARLALYRRTPLRAALMCGLVALVGWLLGRHVSDVDLRVPSAGWGAGMLAAFLAAFAAGTVLGLRQLRSPRGRAFVEAQLGGARLLLPATHQERRWSLAVALSAGVWEELAYRGFLAAVVRTMWPSWSWFAVALVTSAAFGLGHLYQGVKGIVLTGLLGLALASVVQSTGSLYPAMLVHALIDVRSLTVIGWELQRLGPAAPPATAVADAVSGS